MRSVFAAAMLVTAWGWVVSAAAAAPPTIIWGSAPVGPDETALLAGGGFGPACRVEFARLADGSPGGAGPAALPESLGWTTLVPLEADEQCVKFVVPAGGPVGVYACRVRAAGATSAALLLNAPDPWWLQGDGGDAARPGGRLRIFGKCLRLAPDHPPQVALAASGGKIVSLKADEADGYALSVKLPRDLAAAEYTVYVYNGCGGNAAWREAGRITVRAPREWKTAVFNVKDFGPQPGEALLAALRKAEAAGGGIVYLPRGRYPVKDRLVIPPGTVLRGEAMELVNLYWPDLDAPPPDLISGRSFGIESLSIYCQQHRNVIADADQSDGTFVRKVRIRANCYFMLEHAGQEFRGRHGPADHQQCGAAILLRGRNFEVSDCDIYASNCALRIARAKVGLVARNRLLYGGRGYSIENTDRLIFEDNLVAGNNLLAIGNDITTFWTNYCRHIYYAHNRLQQMFGADREMMTLDAGGGAYVGHVAAVEGTRLTLAGDPHFHDYAPRPHSDWQGAAVSILDGTGAGQYRIVTRNAGRDWQVDRPWDIPPDRSSLISIAPFRGRNLFIGNALEDGGAFQLYGAAHDTIVAENKGARMDGFTVWGLNPHGWGHQPSWFCQFLDNEIVEGNGYGGRGAALATITGDESKTFAGPMVRDIIFRRNQCRNNAAINIQGAARDILVERCAVRHAEAGIRVQAAASGVLLRDNCLEDVARPLAGDGIERARIIPSVR